MQLTPALGEQAAMRQTVAGITRAIPGVPSRARTEVVRSPPEVPMQQSASAASIMATQDDAQNGAGTHRPEPSSSRDARLQAVDDSTSVLSPAALSFSNARPETSVGTSHAASEPATLVASPLVPSTIANGTETSPPLPNGQVQPAVFAERAAPADQITPTLVGILKTVDTRPNVTIQLRPIELGQVQIRVDQTTAGNTHIEITVERPETLQLLQREEPKLQQALDQAGVISTGRTIGFQVAPHVQIGAAASRPDTLAADSGGPGQGQHGNAWRQNDDAPRHPGHSPNFGQRQARPRWLRAGLDITA
jgi:flagellar hook-length control protein FliK